MAATLEARAAAVAGFFYAREPEDLRREVRAMLAQAPVRPDLEDTPKALLVPHAGYAYSGPVAASAFALLARTGGGIRRVVLLGPAHRAPVRGLALPGATGFETPLGTVPVDLEAVEALRDLPSVGTDRRAHAAEHSLEVQLPFLQAVLGPFSFVPLVVGEASAARVAEVLERLWGGPETLLVISSDLSHYHPYAEAVALDRRTCERIAGLHLLEDAGQACGAAPLNGLLLAARRRGLRAVPLDLRNSGDTAGDRSRVVGYAAFAFFAGGAHGRG
jgi:hypothetical protein